MHQDASLDKPIENLTATELRAVIVQRARSYVGVKYQHQGRDSQFGLDCLGLLLQIAKDFNFRFTDRNDYRLDPDGYMLVEELSANMTPLPSWCDALPADVVLMRYHISRPPQHIGIVTEVGTDLLNCVHASRRSRMVTENRWDRLDLVTHAFRIKELAAITERLDKQVG